MRKDKPTKLYSVRMTYEEARKFEEIASVKGQTKSGIFRTWINRDHKRLTNK